MNLAVVFMLVIGCLHFCIVYTLIKSSIKRKKSESYNQRAELINILSSNQSGRIL
jgi:hypothetical protein